MTTIVHQNRPIIFFDGHCHLCHWLVRLVLKTNSRVFFLAALQSKTAREQLPREFIDRLDTVVLKDRDLLYTSSSAAIRIVSSLSWYYKPFKLALIVPKFLRDFCYEWISRNRYRLFGRSEQCLIPNEQEREFFLD
jgi:predicted DCC family thiol-disulfide oxidoreductase YuxK